MIKKHSTQNNRASLSNTLVSGSSPSKDSLDNGADKCSAKTNEEATNGVNNGCKALVALCQWLHIPLPEAEIHPYFLTSTDFYDIERTAVIAKKIGFKVKVESGFSKANLGQIEKTLPVILFSKSQNKWYLLLKKERESHWFVYPVGSQKPILLEASAVNDLLISHVVQIKPSYKLSIQQKLVSSSWFISTIKKYKKLFFEVLVAGFFIQLFALITPLFFQVVMDKVLVHQSFSTLNVIGFAFAVVISFEAILSLLRGYLLTHTSSRIDVELGSKLFAHLIHLPLGWFERRQTGQVVSRVKELDTLREFMTSTLLALLIDLPFLFIFLFIMALYSLPLTLVVVAVLSPLVAVAAMGLPILRRQLNQRFKHGAENQSYLVEKITSPQLFKGLRLEQLIQRGWEDRLARYAKSHFTTAITGLLMGQSAAFINKVMLVAILWYGAHLVIDNTMTVGALIAFNLFAMRVSGPILNVMQMFQQFSEAKLSIEKLTDIVETPVEVDVAQGEHHLPIKDGQIVFNNVSFAYGANKVLQQLSIDINAGETIAIVGQSGSGKSTIAKLLQRLYLPDSGMVQLDGANLQQFSLSQLRKKIGVVNQHTELWSGTIAENIALAKPMSSTDEIIRVAHLLGAHGFITSFEKGYNHQVCEAGANLSGGQRQRLAIARVLLMQPSILVLDEATSAMDPLMEANFYDHLFQSYQNTMIIIAHRLSSIRRCDRILVMDDGRVVEQGSHDQLIAKNKLYRQMWDSQMYASSRDVDLYGEPLADRENNNTVAVGE